MMSFKNEPFICVFINISEVTNCTTLSKVNEYCFSCIYMMNVIELYIKYCSLLFTYFEFPGMTSQNAGYQQTPSFSVSSLNKQCVMSHSVQNVMSYFAEKMFYIIVHMSHLENCLKPKSHTHVKKLHT